MKHLHLPESIQNNIRDFMMSTQNTLDNQVELEQFMKMLTPNFQEEITTHIFKQAFDMNTFLKNYPDIIKKIIGMTIPSLEQPDFEVLHQGNEATHFFFIADGDCRAQIKTHTQEEVESLSQLKKGDYFGEISVLHDCPISASVRTINYCTFAKIPR